VPTREIEEFAKLLVRYVRDASIRSCDSQLRPNSASPIAKRWRNAQEGAGAETQRVMVPDCVDDAVFHLLYAIDQGLFQLSFTSSSGRTVNLNTEARGELAGWYMDGWRQRFSEQRFVDEDLGTPDD
jgi:hypothetical protein